MHQITTMSGLNGAISFLHNLLKKCPKICNHTVLFFSYSILYDNLFIRDFGMMIYFLNTTSVQPEMDAK